MHFGNNKVVSELVRSSLRMQLNGENCVPILLCEFQICVLAGPHTRQSNLDVYGNATDGNNSISISH